MDGRLNKHWLEYTEDIHYNDSVWKLYSTPNVTLNSGDGYSGGTLVCSANSTLKNANYVKLCITNNGGRNPTEIVIDRTSDKSISHCNCASYSSSAAYFVQLALGVLSDGSCRGSCNIGGWSFTCTVISIYYR